MGPGQEMITNPVVRIGDRCLIGRGTSIIGHLAIEIGDDVYTGMNVYITDQNHGYENLEVSIGKQLPNEKSVSIGESSWIGSGAIILPGSKIGDHVVIGANSVVTGEIPSHSVAVGSPARVVRKYDGKSWERQDSKGS
jgi:acetyltransferase-like isoleucine patch superfamily enzyme